MSDASTPRKRSISEDETLPTFDDPADMINAVISQLQAPEEKTNVALSYANNSNPASEVQAYAKIAGQDWTFYVKSLAVSIGRNTEAVSGNQQSQSQPHPQGIIIDIDLGPAKVVSRQHANITYNLDYRCWELKVLGRNGARIDGQKVPVGEHTLTPLHSGAILDIGGTQMMFILPDSAPTLLKKLLNQYLLKYKANLNKRKAAGLPSSSSSSSYPQQHSMVHQQPPPPQIKSFQMFDKNQLNQSPSTSATSLQNNLDQDLSKEDAKDIKPPYSYATMITQAILSNTDGVMSLSEIYNWIGAHYAYYKYSKTGWQNSIRHNLSLNKAFEKVPRRPSEPGKGMKWQISELYKNDFLNKIQNGSILKARRGSSVSRQLQLHLATHQGLPETQKYYLKELPIPHHNHNLQQQQQQQQIHNHQQHFTNDGLPKLGQPMQFAPQIPQNPVQPNALAFLQQQTGFPGHMQQQQQQHQQHQQHHQQQQQQQQQRFGFQNQAPYMVYGMPPPQMPQQQQQQQQQIQQQQMQQLHQSQQQQNLQQNLQHMPMGNHLPVNAKGEELSSPIRQLNDLNNLTPKLPKVSGNNLYNLPPPPANSGSTKVSSAPHAHHSRNNSLNNVASMTNESKSASSTVNSTAKDSSELTGGTSTAGPSDLSIGFTSPKKITPLEAFTPERGSKSTGGNKLGIPGTQTNQSSPAFWNFVQFSTPNGQTPMRKDSEILNEQGSPTLNRKQLSSLNDNSPLKSKNETSEIVTSKRDEVNA